MFIIIYCFRKNLSKRILSGYRYVGEYINEENETQPFVYCSYTKENVL